jgi:hypothetical protein
MPTSEARIRANQQNALLSTGPKTSEGKEKSRQNALKHGLTGEGVVLIDEDAAEVERRYLAMSDEMRPSGEMGKALVRRLATLSVRLERSVLQENATLKERVLRAEADFEVPEGLDDDEADRLRAEAGRRALFDPSKEATLARKYEAAAERGLFRSLKEFRQVEREAKTARFGPDPAEARKALGSFLPVETIQSILDDLPVATPSKPARPVANLANSPSRASFEVPMTIGRAG